MKMMRATSFSIFLFASFFYFANANACASCGSGGDDPLILYPNEWLKVYLGVSHQSNFKNVDSNGDFRTAGGPTSKQSLAVAGGYSFSPRSFATVTVPLQRNTRDDKSRMSVGDPSIAGRYSVLMQSFDEPYVPQVQLLLGYKFSQSRSIHESKDLKTLLDVFGNGFSEARTGVDVWFGVTPLKVGFAQTFSMPIAKTYDGVIYQPGIIYRSTFSLGYLWFDEWKVTGGINREFRDSLKASGEIVPESKQLNHSLFLTTDWMFLPNNNLRLSFSQQAAAFDNYNTSRATSLSLACMHSF